MPDALSDFLRRPAPSWMRVASLTLLHAIAGIVLLLVSALVPLAAWHRLYFRRRGWWLMPSVYGVVALITNGRLMWADPRAWMFIAVASPLAALWIFECHLILRAAPALARKQVVFDKLGLSEDLPLGKPKDVRLPAVAPGEYEFTCQMGMYRGVLVARSPS